MWPVWSGPPRLPRLSAPGRGTAIPVDPRVRAARPDQKPRVHSLSRVEPRASWGAHDITYNGAFWTHMRRTRSRAGAILCVLCTLGLWHLATPVPGLLGAFGQDRSQDQIGWTCPMHREVLEKAPGTCPICKMDLVQTRVESAWTCPVHAVVVEDREGTCRICRRALVPVSLEVAWVCPLHPSVSQVDPGACRICGTALVQTRTARPHEDHRPKHGGVFFMAPDSWHHVEGVLPEPGLFRLYVYDNYSQALDVGQVTGRAVTKEVYDAAKGERVEVDAVPLRPSADGRALEARIGDAALPVEVIAKVVFRSGGEEDRFDFVFAEYSKEPDPGTAPTGGAPTGGLAPPAVSAPLVIPDQPDQIAAEIVIREQRIRDLLASGALAEIFVPALEAKDLALALDERIGPGKVEARIAVKDLVRAAWLLDGYADTGDRQRAEEAQALFSAAVEAIKKEYGR